MKKSLSQKQVERLSDDFLSEVEKSFRIFYVKLAYSFFTFYLSLNLLLFLSLFLQSCAIIIVR